MPQLVIIGAGGFGREVFEWARQAWGFEGAWRFRGFLDDNPAALDGFDYPGRILGPVADYVPQPDDRFLCAVGRPALKEKLVAPIAGRGGQFAQLIHPSVVVGRQVEFGEGFIACPRVVLTCDIRIGRHVALNVATAVGHDVVIGDFCQMSSFCDLTGGVQLGRAVLVGSHASILPQRTVGDGATVGAGSVVIHRVKPGQTVFGAPARPLHLR